MRFIEVTILVPESDIELIDYSVEKVSETRYEPPSAHVSVNEIEVKGLQYDIVDFDDGETLSEIAINRWNQL